MKPLIKVHPTGSQIIHHIPIFMVFFWYLGWICLELSPLAVTFLAAFLTGGPAEQAACCLRSETPLPCLLITSPLALGLHRSWDCACPGPRRQLSCPQLCGFELVLGIAVTSAISRWLWNLLTWGRSERMMTIYNEVIILALLKMLFWVAHRKGKFQTRALSNNHVDCLWN